MTVADLEQELATIEALHELWEAEQAALEAWLEGTSQGTSEFRPRSQKAQGRHTIPTHLSRSHSITEARHP